MIMLTYTYIKVNFWKFVVQFLDHCILNYGDLQKCCFNCEKKSLSASRVYKVMNCINRHMTLDSRLFDN